MTCPLPRGSPPAQRTNAYTGNLGKLGRCARQGAACPGRPVFLESLDLGRRSSNEGSRGPRAKRAALRNWKLTEKPNPEKPLRRRKQRMIAMAPGRPAYEADLFRMIAPLLQRGIPVKVRMHPFRATCGAKTRRGTPCRSFALKNGRCRLHGGLSTGPKSQEGWERTRAGYEAWRARQRDKGG